MNNPFFDTVFTNADQEVVEYDGSPVTWRVSAYVIVRCSNTILIIKNKLEKLFDIVGGGIEFGEDIEKALRREAREEAGVDLKLGKILDAQVGWFFHRQGSFHQTLQLFYQAEIVGDLIEPTETDIEWRGFVPIDEIGVKYRLPEFVEKVIKEKLV